MARRCITDVLNGDGGGSISNTVEIATGWYKPQEHFPPVNIDISQAIRYAL